MGMRENSEILRGSAGRGDFSQVGVEIFLGVGAGENFPGPVEKYLEWGNFLGWWGNLKWGRGNFLGWWGNFS